MHKEIANVQENYFIILLRHSVPAIAMLSKMSWEKLEMKILLALVELNHARQSQQVSGYTIS